MKKNIYMMLNDISTDTSGYPDTQLTEEELQKYRKNIKKRLGKRRRKVICACASLAACFTVVAVLIYFRPMEGKMRASTVKSTYTMSSMLGVPYGLEDKTIKIGETRLLDGASVVLNSVAADEGQIVVYSTYAYDDVEDVPRISNGIWGREYYTPFERTESILMRPKDAGEGEVPDYTEWECMDSYPFIQKMYINGVEQKCRVNADIKATEDGVVQDLARYYLDTEEFEYPAQVKIEIYRDVDEKEPEAVFEFTLDKEMLIQNEKEITLDQTVELPDGQKMVFDKFVHNMLGTRFYAHYSVGRTEVDCPIPFTLESHEYQGVTEWFTEELVSDTESVFESTDNNMYEMIPDISNWDFDIWVRFYEGGHVNERLLQNAVRVP